MPDPSSTSAPFELSTGAADADSYHDFFRLQIAFEDVWAELLDTTIEPTGKKAYALWDALMDQGLASLARQGPSEEVFQTAEGRDHQRRPATDVSQQSPNRARTPCCSDCFKRPVGHNTTPRRPG